jgi:hypothetical protein
MFQSIGVREFVGNRHFGRACALAGLLALHLADAPSANACSLVVEQHELDENEVGVDTGAPSVTVESIDIREGVPEQRSGCWTKSFGGCDGIGWVRVRIAEVSDDRTPVESMGYRLIIEGDTGDTGLSEGESTTFRANDDGEFFLHFIDSDKESEGDWNFTVRVVAVDLAGNESEPTSARRLEQSSKGCSVAPGGSRSSTFLPVVAALLWMRRRVSGRA